MGELSRSEARSMLGTTRLNLIRRGVDGSLRLSADRWVLAEGDDQALRFRTESANGLETLWLEIEFSEVERVTWDRLPKQQKRSQVRFHFQSGDLWTFSGHFPDQLD